MYGILYMCYQDFNERWNFGVRTMSLWNPFDGCLAVPAVCITLDPDKRLCSLNSTRIFVSFILLICFCNIFIAHAI